MQKKIYQTFHGNINGIDIYNSNIYFALESILKSVEKTNPHINTNHKKLTKQIYFVIKEKEYYTKPNEFEDWNYSLCRYIEKSDPDNICKILNVEFGI